MEHRIVGPTLHVQGNLVECKPEDQREAKGSACFSRVRVSSTSLAQSGPVRDENIWSPEAISVSLNVACLADTQFMKEEIQMSDRQMEKYSSSLAIQEIPKISFLIPQFGEW